MAQSTTWNPDSYAKNARFVSDLGEPLIELLAPKSGELILDLGCGDGALTEKIAATGAKIIGVDASLAQAHAARARAISVCVMDGERLAAKRRFDAVVTNAALHWMKQAEAVVAGVAAALKPGGRFVGEFGGKGNVATIRRALHSALRRRGVDPWCVDPWYNASPEEYTDLLSRHGFKVESIELIPRPTKLPSDILAWLEIFAQSFSNAVKPTEQKEFLNEVIDGVRGQLQQPDGTWYADYVRLRFKAIR